LIETEIVLYGDNDPLEGCDLLMVADEDARLYELGSDLLKNSGCAKAHPVMVKRKDFIFTLNHCQENRIVACGLIWSADLEEELMRGGERGGIVEVGRISWYDEDSIYGRPALALMGPLGSDWRELRGSPRISVDNRYPLLSGEYLKNLKHGGYTFRQTGLGGLPCRECVGTRYDAAVGLIDSFEVVDRTGLWPLEKIVESEPVIVRLRGPSE